MKKFNTKDIDLKNNLSSSQEDMVSDEDAEPPPPSTILEKSKISHKESEEEIDEPPGTTAVTSYKMYFSVCGIERSAQPYLRFFKDLVLPKRKPSSGVGMSFRSRVFCSKFFTGVTQAEWDDWRWQLKNRITDLRTLERILYLSSDERDAFTRYSGTLPVAVTPYYASLLNRRDPHQPLRRTVIPVMAEKLLSFGETIDPLAEDKDSPVPGLVHRYPDRVLFLVTSFCSVNCRYCTRSRIVGDNEEYHFGKIHWERAISYIEQNFTIRDVLLSGGDPLTLPDVQLEYLLKRLRRIPHIEIVRIGTKVPVVLPQRITLSLVRMLKRFHPLWMSIHFTHPEELTPEVIVACARLADAGIPLGSQTVLLKGINDDVDTMKMLMHGLMKIRVRPYYLYQCDPIRGSSHFRTPVEKGIEIIRGLRGHTSGYAVPHYVIDAPGGGGKIPICPDYVLGKDGDHLVLQNYEGLLFRYPDRSGK